MKNKALWLLLCGCLASIPSAALADSAVAVQRVAVVSAQSESDKTPRFTDEQLEKIHALKGKFEDARGARAVEIHKLHRQIFDNLASSNADRAGIMATQAKINALEADQANERLQMMLDMHDVFTPEQRQLMRHHLLEMDMRNPIGPGVASPSGFGGYSKTVVPTAKH
jgi:Spy/CpxP family protein refolding chaperone